ncbi:ion transporter [Alkalicella caledoniensis]|uniref:ion transporter n=1 Tax=Alkalicella caledoniensis TaxID=2731377 RepID=UPI001FEB1813|nr:ion transporter [Alkalicella caledoniensis]
MGKAFDILLILTIIFNSALMIFESVESVRESYGFLITSLGWFFIFIFTIEYLLRVYVAHGRMSYIFSFFGIIDLLAILPAFFVTFLPQARLLVIFRIFRLLRLFSILKMGRYIEESSQLMRALKASRAKITVFLFTILFIIVIVGSMMYVIEGPENGFVSIPESMYWAIVTVSTVGYGDISPQTSVGKFVSGVLMIIGYSIIAVPTGIISNELAHTTKNLVGGKQCRHCNWQAGSLDDKFCPKCGKEINIET